MQDRKKMMQVLVPGVAAAAVVLLVGVLVATSDWNTEPTEKTKLTGKAALDDTGMSDRMPPRDAVDWKPQLNGLKIWDVIEGEGPECPKDAYITVHYTGWLTNGTQFDTSRDTKVPTSMPLSSFIQGWQKGIPGMKRGGIRRIEIPPNLAYGPEGRGSTIPPDATLVFEIKLIAFQ